MKTFVTILAGKNRGRTGFIRGDLDKLNPHVTRVWVHFKTGNPTQAGRQNIARANALEISIMEQVDGL